MSMTIELSDHDVEYLKKGNKVFKKVEGLIVVVKYKI